MLKYIFKALFGTNNDRIIKKLKKEVEKINNLEDVIVECSDMELQSKTEFFRHSISQGTSLDDILHEAFAVVREASRRLLKMRHFDVQIMAGIILHRGMISEMKTGEGKTLASALPMYLNGLKSSVHVVTANEYLAKRDAEMMKKLMDFLNLSVGVIYNGMEQEERLCAYRCDIVYGTSSEFGFDYLKDNMRYEEQRIQLELNYVLIDEADSVLIDEARTPLVISGPAKYTQNMYAVVDTFVSQLKPNHFEIEENNRNIFLTDEGIEYAEQYLIARQIIQNQEKGIYDASNISLLHLINQSLRAYFLFKKDVEYVVRDNMVCIVDSLTGRIMDGRRYSDGLHQAIEQKERVKVREENKTLASITIQNYFKMYHKIAGMTGTAMTEAAELKDIYDLDVVAIPTNNKIARIDQDDKIYGTLIDKHKAILEMISENHKLGRPILIGTASIASSEEFSNILSEYNIPHNVLNAKNHEMEAYIIAEAGRYGAVTIATNMAGRGTDIILGGTPITHLISDLKENEEINSDIDSKDCTSEAIDQNNDKQRVIDAGGLLVIGTERHESRRIDNQLRGRGGRQGDPGTSVFYLSLEDNLMKMLINESTAKMLKNLGLKDGEAIHHPFITRGISKTQQKIETMNYESRKNLIKFDNVINRQRKIIYEYRDRVLLTREDLYDIVTQITESWLKKQVQTFIPKDSFKEDWHLSKLSKHLDLILNYQLNTDKIQKEDITVQELEYGLLNHINTFLANRIFDLKLLNEVEFKFKDEPKENNLDNIYQNDRDLIQKAISVSSYTIKATLLRCLDTTWQDHINALDSLKQNMYMRSYGQKDPFIEYNRETFEMFEKTLDRAEEIFLANYSRLNLADKVFQDLDMNYLENNDANELDIIHQSGTLAYDTSEHVGQETNVSSSDNILKDKKLPNNQQDGIFNNPFYKDINSNLEATHNINNDGPIDTARRFNFQLGSVPIKQIKYPKFNQFKSNITNNKDSFQAQDKPHLDNDLQASNDQDKLHLEVYNDQDKLNLDNNLQASLDNDLQASKVSELQFKNDQPDLISQLNEKITKKSKKKLTSKKSSEESSENIDVSSGASSENIDLSSGASSENIDLSSGASSENIDVSSGASSENIDVASGASSENIDLSSGASSENIDLSNDNLSPSLKDGSNPAPKPSSKKSQKSEATKALELKTKSTGSQKNETLESWSEVTKILEPETESALEKTNNKIEKKSRKSTKSSKVQDVKNNFLDVITTGDDFVEVNSNNSLTSMPDEIDVTSTGDDFVEVNSNNILTSMPNDIKDYIDPAVKKDAQIKTGKKNSKALDKILSKQQTSNLDKSETGTVNALQVTSDKSEANTGNAFQVTSDKSEANTGNAFQVTSDKSKTDSCNALQVTSSELEPQDTPNANQIRRRNDPCFCGSNKRYKHCHGQENDVRNDKAGFSNNKPKDLDRQGRNELCLCGSGKRYKHCHGKDF